MPRCRISRALFQHHPHFLTLVHDDGVEPTNNSAERALRTAVQWRKIMFGTRSTEGERAVARLLTVTRTCQLQQISVLAYLTAAISCHRRSHAVASLLQRRSTPPELLLILPIVRISGGRQTSSLISRPWSGEDLLLPVIRWRLRGVVSDVVCSIERRPEGYRFLIHRAGEIEQDEVLRDVRHARTKTQALREVLLSAGFIPVT